MANFQLSGVADALRRFKEIENATTRAAAQALYMEGNNIMAESKTIVPVDTGTLRATGSVFPPEVSGDTIEVTLGYGGAASAYAVVQHERTDFHHPGQGQAKYLEKPAMAAAKGLGARIALKLRGAIR